jgi:hypothetical protein
MSTRTCLYLDNFRGFTNTTIPITDVNFLVGENSTGKTSVLAALKLLSTPQFWFEQSFEHEDVHLGHFDDMVSVHASDRTFFRIGQVSPSEPSRKTDEGGATAFLFTFVSRNGLPEIHRCTANFGPDQIHLVRSGKKVLYKYERSSSPLTFDSLVLEVLPKWSAEHQRPANGYEMIAPPRGLGRRVPLLAFFSLILPKVRKVAKERDDVAFMVPASALDRELVWVAPIRTKARRTYDELTLDFSSEGLHTPYLIRKILGSKAEATKFKSFIARVGAASGLFESVQIRRFGGSITAPFELDIVIDNKALNLSSVGYGVSQSLPVFVELLARRRGSWFAIQQPEVHLHPRAQAALGDVFFEMAARENKRFLIETHSDFTIDRFRMNYKNNRVNNPSGQILFFERRNKQNAITHLVIDESGRLPVKQPRSYREFFLKEALKTATV